MPVNGSCATDFLTFLWPSYILARPGGGWDELIEEAKWTGPCLRTGDWLLDARCWADAWLYEIAANGTLSMVTRMVWKKKCAIGLSSQKRRESDKPLE
jgi:hypothetical protein